MPWKRWIIILVAIILVTCFLMWASKPHETQNEIVDATVVEKIEASHVVVVELPDGSRHELESEELFDYCQVGEVLHIETTESWFWRPSFIK